MTTNNGCAAGSGSLLSMMNAVFKCCINRVKYGIWRALTAVIVSGFKTYCFW